VNDAFRMQEIVAAKFSTQRLLNEEATYDVVIGAIKEASNQLMAGDIFVFTFSGHGGRDPSSDPDEGSDFQDESIVLYDKILIDDVFRRSLWPLFKNGVRILAVSDCCHAEGAFTVPPGDDNENVADNNFGTVGSPILTGTQETSNDNVSSENAIRELDFGSKGAHFNKLQEFYDEVRAKLPSKAPPINADLLTLSACEASEKARDGFPNGVYTKALFDIMKEGLPANYEKLHEAIALKLEEELQHPVLTLFEGSDPGFPKQVPFSI
jgi:caspase domain-containing protein